MSRTLKVRIYQYDELPTDEAKTKAREWFTKDGENIQSEDIAEQMYQDLDEGSYRKHFKVYYSLNNCQGDGACFTGEISLSDFFEGQVKIREQFRGQIQAKGEKPQSVNDRLEALYVGDSVFAEIKTLIDQDVEATIAIKHVGRYYHWNSMNLTVEIDDYGKIDQGKIRLTEEAHRAGLEAIDAQLSDLEKSLDNDWAKDVARHLEETGYAEINNAYEEEVVAENIRINNYWFLANGRRNPLMDPD